MREGGELEPHIADAAAIHPLPIDSVTSIAAVYRFSPAFTKALHPDACGTDAAFDAMEGPRLACAEAEGECVCTGETEPETVLDVLPLSVAGVNLQVGESAGTFCVNGDRLTLDFDAHPISWRWWVLLRD